MKLENQVCTIEQGKKLEQLGIIAIPVFCHYRHNSDEDIQIRIGTTGFVAKTSFKGTGDPEFSTTWISPAFTVAELGVMLPSETFALRTGNSNSRYARWGWVDQNNDSGKGLFATQAEALADLIIMLLESGELTAEECNLRLLNS